MINHILTCAVKSTFYFLIGIPVIFIGYGLVAVALPFRITSINKLKFTIRPELGEWQLVTLPSIFKWWSNEFDGAYGDKRGWWANYCIENYGKDYKSFRAMWQWLAVRNPANYFNRVVTGCDVSQCVIQKLAGYDIVTEEPGVSEWQFLVATNENRSRYHRFFCSIPWWFDKTHAVNIDIGWKIKLSHNGMPKDSDIKDKIKGSVFTPSLWKNIA